MEMKAGLECDVQQDTQAHISSLDRANESSLPDAEEVYHCCWRGMGLDGTESRVLLVQDLASQQIPVCEVIACV